jgi:hypothetical protein
MNKVSFAIEKKIGNTTSRMVNGSEVWELDDYDKANEICLVLNTNTDSNCTYTVLPINSNPDFNNIVAQEV